jgi:ubiquitin-protein ligase E3 C
VKLNSTRIPVRCSPKAIMFQFSGSSRRPRQVNLSGQNYNTRRSVLPTQNTNGIKMGGKAAVAQAQVQRSQRESERKRVNGIRLLQRLWRGHSSRQKTRQAWREEWDRYELARRDLQQAPLVEKRPRFSRSHSRGNSSVSLAADDCSAQMRLLLHFVDVRLDADRLRLASFHDYLRRKVEEIPSLVSGDSWTMQLFRLSKLTLNAIDLSGKESKSGEFQQLRSLLSLLLFLANLVPTQVSGNARRYYSVLAGLLVLDEESFQGCNGEIRQAVGALLTPVTSESLTAYVGFVAEYLTAPNALVRLGFDRWGPVPFWSTLTAAFEEVLDASRFLRAKTPQKTHRALWLLAHLTYLHGHVLGSTADAFVKQLRASWLRMLSFLLLVQGTALKSRMDLADMVAVVDSAKQKGRLPNGHDLAPLPPFIQEQMLAMTDPRRIEKIVAQVESQQDAEIKPDPEMLQSLAAYGMSLKKAFPNRTHDISKWLNLKTENANTLTLCFWNYTKSTEFFRGVSKNHRKAIPLVKSALNIGQSMSAKAIQRIQEEWTPLLLFLELYYFAIRDMDDQEFCASSRSDSATPRAMKWGNGLSLLQVQELTIFLKNLAFTLYWHAGELKLREKADMPVGSLSALFESTARESSLVPRSQTPSRDIVSHESTKNQCRDLVTGLLRSIHQRELVTMLRISWALSTPHFHAFSHSHKHTLSFLFG